MYKIVEKKWLTPIICYMDIEAPDLATAALPGQFLIIKTDDKGERRSGVLPPGNASAPPRFSPSALRNSHSWQLRP